MKLATFIGITIPDFWEITPFELSVAAGSYTKRKEMDLKTDQQLLTIQAYEISRWVWAKKLDIKRILSEINSGTKEMTDNEMLQKVKVLNALFGGEVKNIG